jgi:hypothetical protein
MEHGQIVETIQQELEESSTRELTYADLQKRDTVTKGLRPKYNDEEPRDYMAANATPDIDASLFKATNAQADPDETTRQITQDVLRRLASGDDLRRNDDAEPPESRDDDEPSEPPADLQADIAYLKAERRKGVDTYELVNSMLHTDYARAKQLARANAWLEAA